MEEEESDDEDPVECRDRGVNNDNEYQLLKSKKRRLERSEQESDDEDPVECTDRGANDDNENQPPKSKKQILERSSQGIPAEFQRLLSIISNWYDELECLNMLKVLYRGHVSYGDLDKASAMMDILEVLFNSDDLSPSDCTILYDTINLTKQFGLQREIIEQIPSFPNVKGMAISKFSTHRQRLMKFGMALTQDDVATINNHYNAPRRKKYADSWNMILDLEKKFIIREGKMETFIKELKKMKLYDALVALCEGDDQLALIGIDNINAVMNEAGPSRSPMSTDSVIRDYLLRQQEKCLEKIIYYNPPTHNEENLTIDIAGVFTDLELVKRDGRGKRCNATPATLDQVLEVFRSKDSCRALIEGEGGMGKTTLLRYISYRWATGKDDTFSGKIVFLIEIRDINQGEDVVNVILSEIDLEEFSQRAHMAISSEMISGFITTHDDEIVLLLDGMDELTLHAKSPIHIFKRKRLMNSKVILTSRPGNTSELGQEFDAYVKVLGFNSNSITQYIDKFFKHEKRPDLGQSLIEKLMKYQNEDDDDDNNIQSEFFEICCSPMLLLSICAIWEDNQCLPENMACLFKELFCNILNQFIMRDVSCEPVYQFDNIPQKYVNALLVLGKCAYAKLQINKLYIDEKDLNGNEDENRLALKIGFIYKDPSIGVRYSRNTFRTPHKLMFESLAGFYICRQCQQGIRLEWNKIRSSKYLHMTCVFAVNFLGAEAGKFLQHWITNHATDYRSLMTLLMKLEKVHQLAVVKELDVIISGTDLGIKQNFQSMCSSLRSFVLHCNLDFKVSTDDHVIQLMREVRILESRLGSFTESVDAWIVADSLVHNSVPKMLSHMIFAAEDQHRIIETNAFISGSEDVFDHITAELENLNLVYDMDDINIENTHTSGFSIGHLLKYTPNMVHLGLFESLLTANVKDMLSICNSGRLPTRSALSGMTLQYNDFHDMDGATLSSLLSIFPELCYVNVDGTHLSSVAISEMVSDLKHIDNILKLQTFCLGSNDLCNIDGQTLADLFVIAPNLEHLTLMDCKLSGDIVYDMIEKCQEQPRLYQLLLHGNNLNDIHKSSLAKISMKFPNLEYLGMMDCQLTGSIVRDMVKECVDRDLVLNDGMLDLKGNDLHDIDDTTMYTLLEKRAQFNCLECISTVDQLNTVIDKCRIENIVLGCTKLETTSLDHSSCITGATLSGLFAIAPNLEHLGLSSCNLSGAIIKDMLSICNSGQLPSRFALTTLLFEENNFHDMEGATLSSLLAIFPELCHLNVNNCNLSSVPISEMISELRNINNMLKLKWFNLGQNDLRNIDGLTLADLLAIAPNLEVLDIHECKLSGDIVYRMIDKCQEQLILHQLILHDNNLNDIPNSSLAKISMKFPNLEYLGMGTCQLTGSIVRDMVKECADRDLILNDGMLDLKYNGLHDIGDVTMYTLLERRVDFNFLECISTVDQLNTVIDKCRIENIVLGCTLLETTRLDHSSWITGATLSGLFAIAPKLAHLGLSGCNLSGAIIKDMLSICNSGGLPTRFALKVLNLENNDFHDMDGATLSSLLAIFPELNDLRVSTAK